LSFSQTPKILIITELSNENFDLALSLRKNNDIIVYYNGGVIGGIGGIGSAFALIRRDACFIVVVKLMLIKYLVKHIVFFQINIYIYKICTHHQ
jgi:hypothetical protein